MKYFAEVYVLYTNNTWKFQHIQIPEWMYHSLDTEMVEMELFDMIYKPEICSLRIRTKYSQE
jgi:hypothetical protein